MTLPRLHRAVVLALAASALGLLFVPEATAQPTLRLTINPATITFAAADPDTTPSIAAPSVSVRYRVRDNTSGSWRITLLAGGDLTAGAATIPITNVTWTATPTPRFQSGTLSRALAQTLATGSGNVQNLTTGTATFWLANSWTYNVGSYSTSVVFTLTAP